MSGPAFTLRPYTSADEDAAIALWLRTWQLAYPRINFAARVDWWRERWRLELVPVATITVAEAEGKMVGFVTVDPSTFDLDQIVVAPEAWGGGVAAALKAVINCCRSSRARNWSGKKLRKALNSIGITRTCCGSISSVNSNSLA